MRKCVVGGDLQKCGREKESLYSGEEAVLTFGLLETGGWVKGFFSSPNYKLIFHFKKHKVRSI
jgi:hypothetical protein